MATATTNQVIYSQEMLEAMPVGSIIYGVDWIADDLPLDYLKREDGQWILNVKEVSYQGPRSTADMFKSWKILYVKKDA